MSCSVVNTKTEYKQYVTIDGHRIELVSDDEYGNLYMKQRIGKDFIYIPYTFEVDDSEEQDFENIYTAK